MIDKKSIIDQVVNTLPEEQSKRAIHIENSFMFAIMDMSNKLIDQDRMAVDTVSVAADDRTAVLTGISYDIDKIFYIRYGEGDEQKLLEHRPIEEFLEKYDNDNADPGTPSYYTYLGIDQSTGYPKVKFDVPAESATTMEVYYFVDTNPVLLKNSQGPALVNCTLAYVFGRGTAEGRSFHHEYRKDIVDVRANAKRIVDRESKFVQNIVDENISDIRWSIRSERK